MQFTFVFEKIQLFSYNQNLKLIKNIKSFKIAKVTKMVIMLQFKILIIENMFSFRPLHLIQMTKTKYPPEGSRKTPTEGTTL